MKKVISTVLAIIMIVAMTTVSFAAVTYDNTDADAALSFGGSTVITVPADEAESFTIDVIFDISKSGLDDISTIDTSFELDGVKFVGTTPVTINAVGTLTAPNGSKIGLYTASDAAVSSDFEAVNKVIATIALAKDTDADTAAISFSGVYIANGAADMEVYDEVAVGATIKFESSKPANPAEEIFEEVTKPAAVAGTIESDDKSESITLTSAAKQVAVFGKAPADAALEAYSYGIIFGGKQFAGAAKVDAGKSWCIKLIAPNGYLGEFSEDKAAFAGKYAVTIFRGEAKYDANTVTVE